jgi:cell division protein FtsW (lipid II flippase)
MRFRTSIPPDPNHLQARLLVLAGLFLVFFALALSLAPSARARNWQVEARWDHWLGVLAWVGLFAIAHHQSARWLPERDPYLLPVAGLLSGWGVLTIWRLDPQFGQRQAIWLGVSMGVLVFGLRLLNRDPRPGIGDLGFLRRYKYLWLTAGLLLTALTLLFGTNPSGGELPRLWLGCCGIYLQPSEPLKLLLIFYLAAYLAGRPARQEPGSALLPLLAPTLLMTGLALLLLVFQRDLGTASIFLLLYALVVYIATGRKGFLAAAGVAVALAGAAGYALFDVVRLRVDAWLNPWADASGRSYQVVQSLLAVANGGLFGRGPGLGSPGVVPVPHSDFIFVAIAEETGLLGATGLILLLALLAGRGLRAALAAPDAYRRYLAAGLTAYLAAQSILIIGGNLRLLPLTGVTLPFVSYGGSSLLTSFLSLIVLIHVSAPRDGSADAWDGDSTDRAANLRPIRAVAGFLWTGLAATTLLAGWWALYRSPELLARTDNPRRAIADRYVLRGSLFDRNNRHLTATIGRPGEYSWYSLYPDLSPITGYTHPVYGQAGLEASLDSYLRGLQGYPGLEIWANHLLYGQPPPGLDVRLSLDLELQKVADSRLRGRRGGLVVLDASNGDILVMASHPNFDPNLLGTAASYDELVQQEAGLRGDDAPLLNRATLGQYQTGTVFAPLLLAAFYDRHGSAAALPELPEEAFAELQAGTARVYLSCAGESLAPSGTLSEDWGPAVSAGCPAPTLALARALVEEPAQSGELRGQNEEPPLTPGAYLQAFFQDLGLFTAPALRLPTTSSLPLEESQDFEQLVLGQSDLRASPLQMALAAAALSAGGVRPAPRLVVAVDTPQAGWVVLPYLSEPAPVFTPPAAEAAARALTADGRNGTGRDPASAPLPAWQSLAHIPAIQGEQEGANPGLTWFLAGTLPGWNGTPLALALVLEEDNPALAEEIGHAVLRAALQTE